MLANMEAVKNASLIFGDKIRYDQTGAGNGIRCDQENHASTKLAEEDELVLVELL